MAFGKRFLGAVAAVLAFASTAQAGTLASANAFACGVDSHGAQMQPGATIAGRALRASAGYPGQTLDPDMPSTVKLRIVYEHPDRIEVDHCGGTVIHSRWVVTAAHCVAADRSWDRIEVIAGDANLDGVGVVRRTSRDAICHAGFEYDGLKDDIALIRLEEPLPPEIVPASVDDQGSSSARVGGTALAAGWPVTGRNAGDRRLNKTSLSIREVAVPGYITATSASGGAEGVCRGESGGPLMAYGLRGLQLAGVLSGIQPGTENFSGEECMLAGYEMYFTPIAAFTNWIDTVLASCDHGPAECRGSGAGGAGSMLLAYAPSYSGYAAQPAIQQVAYSQPTVQQVAYTQPVAQQVAYVQTTVPSYQHVQAPVASVPVHSVSLYDAMPSYSTAYVETAPVYETVPSYTTAYVETTPVSEPVFNLGYASTVPTYNVNYVDTASLYTHSSSSRVVLDSYGVQYQDVTPVYVGTTYSQQPTATYEGGYSVAYAESFIYE